MGGNMASTGGGLLSSASGLLGTVGAAMPYVGLGIMVASMVAPLLIGDPKKERAEEIDLRIESARITVEGPAEFHLAGGAGEAFDRDFTGGYRTYQLDEDAVADAVVGASQRGHRINEELRSAVLG